MESAEIFGSVAPCPSPSSSGSQQSCTFHVCHDGISLMSLSWGPLGGPEPSFHKRAPRWHEGEAQAHPCPLASECTVSLLHVCFRGWHSNHRKTKHHHQGPVLRGYFEITPNFQKLQKQASLPTSADTPCVDVTRCEQPAVPRPSSGTALWVLTPGLAFGPGTSVCPRRQR